MRIYPRRFLCHAMALVVLSTVSSGCVKRMSAANEPDQTEASTFAKLRSVTVSADASRVEMTSDKPFTYTSYKGGEPAKIVIDISQTELGQVKSPIEVNRGNIQRIDLVRQPVGGGVLTRVEVVLKKDADFTVGSDPDDRRKLVVALVPVAGEVLPGQPEVKTALAETKEPVFEVKDGPLPEVKIDEKSLAPEAPVAVQVPAVAEAPAAVEAPVAVEATPGGQGLRVAEQDVATPVALLPATPAVVRPEPALAFAQPAEKAAEETVEETAEKTAEKTELMPARASDSRPKAKVGEPRPKAPAAKAEPAGVLHRLNAVTVAADGVELTIEGGVQTFNSFKLTKPDRIVLDLFGLKSSLAKNIVPIGAFGVANARVGTTPDKVRVVLDATDETLPPFEISKSYLGLKIRLLPRGAASAAPVAKAPEAPAKAPAPPVEGTRAEAARLAEVTAEPGEPVAPAPANGEAAEAVSVAAEPLPVAAPLVPVVPAPVRVKAEVPPKRHVRGALESVDFKIVDGVSRITMKLYGSCEPGQPVRAAQGLSLTIRDCQVPKRLQRGIDTVPFGSPVLSITPYQVTAKGVAVAKLLVKLRGNPAFTVSRNGDLLTWDFVNPGPVAVPKLPAAPVVRVKPAPEPKMAEELAPQAQPEESMTEMPKSDADKRSYRKVYKGRRVTLEFSDADVRKIFQLIAEVSQLNFLIADDVTGTISIKLVNVPWDQALDVILDAKGLGMQREGNIVQIKPKAKIQTQADEELTAKKTMERGMELRTAVFEVNYASVGDVATQFAALKSTREGTAITKDDRTSRVIVKDIQSAIDDMRNLLKTLDSPEKQVMIEARIVEASTTFSRDLGVQWGISYADGSASVAGINAITSGFGGIVSSVTGPGNIGSGGMGLGMSFGKLTSNIKIDMRLSAAATIGQVKIISTPKVVTLNNKAAKISQGQMIPYQTTSAEGTQTAFVEAALTLEVTPHITADGSVSMKIKASNNSAGTGNPPPINKKEATTELVVANGETTVIGGIYVDSDTDEDTGVPFLSDIPLLGWIFKSNSKTKIKTELLIFITPKVVN